MKKNFQIVLASSSASRKKIFKNIGFNFITRKPKVDEEKHQRTFKKKKYNIKKITKTLAELKCKSIKKRKSELVIGCDTLIKINNKIIHKAKNIKEAYDLLLIKDATSVIPVTKFPFNIYRSLRITKVMIWNVISILIHI